MTPEISERSFEETIECGSVGFPTAFTYVAVWGNIAGGKEAA
jgi:hypothetical protein